MSLLDHAPLQKSPDTLLSQLTEAWQALSSDVRDFEPDVVVLVARKMPRLVEALQLNLGGEAICVSDQAIPFLYEKLKNARVAIVDDVWNVGTTMLRARDRVQNASPKSIRLFSLGARDAASARSHGVNLAIERSLSEEAFRLLVEAVPQALRCVAKPYDVDFPIIPCVLCAPFNTWDDCWQWLTAKFGEAAHKTVDNVQLAAGVARATVSFPRAAGWAVKVRLYFDFTHSFCNVVPMALAPSLSLSNDYPKASEAQAVFAAIAKSLNTQNGSERREGLARLNTFCDSLLFADPILELFSGLLQRECLTPFELTDFAMQFGPDAEHNSRATFEHTFKQMSFAQVNEYVSSTHRLIPTTPNKLCSCSEIVDRSVEFLQEGLSTLALDSLFQRLAKVVGAEDPAEYSLSEPYNPNEVAAEPYLRLRIGFSYGDILKLFRDNYVDRYELSFSEDFIVSSLLDNFIDRGAVVPTFTLKGDCVRIYRKGEANPRWDEEFTQLQFTLGSMDEDEKKELLGSGRTRIAKINAIFALSSKFDTALTPGSYERGNVGLLAPSVVEREAGELARLMQRFGYLG